MFDLPLPIQPTAHRDGVTCRILPRATLTEQSPLRPDPVAPRPADLDVGPGRPRSSSPVSRHLAEAMQGAIDHAEGIARMRRPSFWRSSTGMTALFWPGPPATTPSPGATR
jgi:hypothetical protein